MSVYVAHIHTMGDWLLPLAPFGVLFLLVYVGVKWNQLIHRQERKRIEKV